MKFNTLQEVYDHVKQHLLTQKVRSIGAVSEKCLYRGPEGTACAIGACMPDELYTEEMENETITDLLRKYPYIKSLFPDSSAVFLQALQYIHDLRNPLEWEDHLRYLALNYGLVP